jgi:hypothetical protein
MYKLIKKNEVVFRSRKYSDVVKYVHDTYKFSLKFAVDYANFSVAYEDI